MSEWDARGHTPHTRVRGTPIAYIIPSKYDMALPSVVLYAEENFAWIPDLIHL